MKLGFLLLATALPAQEHIQVEHLERRTSSALPFRAGVLKLMDSGLPKHSRYGIDSSSRTWHSTFTVAGKTATVVIDENRKRVLLDLDGDGEAEKQENLRFVRSRGSGKANYVLSGISGTVDREDTDPMPVHVGLMGPIKKNRVYASWTSREFLEGRVEMDGRTLPLVLYDQDLNGQYTENDWILLDLNENGYFDSNARSPERLPTREPFNLTGTTYRLSLMSSDGLQIRFDRPSVKLRQRYIPAVGKPALDISGPDFNGRRISLGDYEGKLTLLIFWAQS